jgi:hypothetical protein
MTANISTNRKIWFGLRGSRCEHSYTISIIGSSLSVVSRPVGGGKLPDVAVGDTIGCGYNWAKSEVYFTLNGEILSKYYEHITSSKEES